MIIGLSLSAFTTLHVVLSLIGILCIPAASFFLRISSRDRTAVLTVWLSIVTIFGWYIVFRSHSAMHAPFMVRLLAWPISATPACFLMLVSASAPGSKLIRLIAPQRHVTTDPAAAPPPKREQNGRQISPSGIRP